MHEENFLSNWLRENEEGVHVEMERLKEEAKQEESESGKREVERETERIDIARKCLDRV